MGAAAAGVLLRRAIRRAFRAVCNLLVLLVLLILVLCNKLQGRVLQQSRHSAVRVLLLLSMLRKHRCAIRQTPMPASHPSRTGSTRTTSICIAHRSIAAPSDLAAIFGQRTLPTGRREHARRCRRARSDRNDPFEHPNHLLRGPKIDGSARAQ